MIHNYFFIDIANVRPEDYKQIEIGLKITFNSNKVEANSL